MTHPNARSRYADVPPVPRAGRHRVAWHRAVRARIAEDVALTLADLLDDGVPEDTAAAFVVTGIDALVAAIREETDEALVVGRWAA
jgi:uncharacterized NAD(P)/FAD-binding protein YdhS